MDFPIADLMDEDACYAKLVTWLHPEGLACPRRRRAGRMRIHRSRRAPVLDYRCGHCGPEVLVRKKMAPSLLGHHDHSHQVGEFNDIPGMTWHYV
ncbi:MAG: hypothetical protein ACM35G_12115 [Planctomycetaceae bacterium]